MKKTILFLLGLINGLNSLEVRNKPTESTQPIPYKTRKDKQLLNMEMFTMKYNKFVKKHFIKNVQHQEVFNHFDETVKGNSIFFKFCLEVRNKPTESTQPISSKTRKGKQLLKKEMFTMRYNKFVNKHLQLIKNFQNQEVFNHFYETVKANSIFFKFFSNESKKTQFIMGYNNTLIKKKIQYTLFLYKTIHECYEIMNQQEQETFIKIIRNLRRIRKSDLNSIKTSKKKLFFKFIDIQVRNFHLLKEQNSYFIKYNVAHLINSIKMDQFLTKKKPSYSLLKKKIDTILNKINAVKF